MIQGNVQLWFVPLYGMDAAEQGLFFCPFHIHLDVRNVLYAVERINFGDGKQLRAAGLQGRTPSEGSVE